MITQTPSIGLGPATSKYTEVAETPSWPAPEVGAHEVDPDYLGKRAVMTMVRKARENGWTVRVTHAKGCFPSVGQKPSPQRHSLAVRMYRDGAVAVAVYVENSPGGPWSWDSMYLLSADQPVPRKLATVTAFNAVI